MKNLAFVCLALLAATGCSKKDGAGGGTDCAGVIPAAVDRVTPEMEKDMAQLPKEKVAQLNAKMKEVLMARCTEDKWPAEHLKCLEAGKTNADMKACDKLLPDDQRKKLKTAMKEAMSGIIDLSCAPGSMGKPAAAPAGSGSGS
jgi:hypothetical protein